MDLNDLTVVIPAYNEEETLPKVLDELASFSNDTYCKIIVVNDGSKDKTADILKSINHPNFSILSHKLNKGYGGALKTGLAAVRTEFAITIDADGQHLLEDIKKLFKHIKEVDADLVIGSRKGHKDASLLRKTGKFFIRTLANILMAVPVHDINSGMKIYRTELLKTYLYLCPNTMAFSDIITLIFLNNRHLVLETPISINKRAGGKSTIGLEAAYHTMMEIINIVVLFHPMKIFMPIAILVFLLGFTWSTVFYINRSVLTTGGAFLMSSGVIIFLMGLICEQLAQIRKNK